MSSPGRLTRSPSTERPGADMPRSERPHNPSRGGLISLRGGLSITPSSTSVEPVHPRHRRKSMESRTDLRTSLSTLWIFVMLNYLYCDIVSLMDSELLKQYLTGNVDGLDLTPQS